MMMHVCKVNTNHHTYFLQFLEIMYSEMQAVFDPILAIVMFC